MQEKILAELHDGNFGINKMKELARRFVWWKTIDSDIQEVTLRCMPCLKHAGNPPKVILHNWKPADTAFEKIHLDFAGPINGKYILLIVDAYSKWLEAFIVPSKTPASTIRSIRETIARFGLPVVVLTDNDPVSVSA